MKEVSFEDSFGRALARYSYGLDVGLEIGGGTGDGSPNALELKSFSPLKIIQIALVVTG